MPMALKAIANEQGLDLGPEDVQALGHALGVVVTILLCHRGSSDHAENQRDVPGDTPKFPQFGTARPGSDAMAAEA